MVANLGSQRCWFRSSVKPLIDHGSLKKDEQILFGTTPVMAAAYAPDSGKSTEVYVDPDLSILKVLQEARSCGAKDFHVAGNHDVYRREGLRGAQ